MYMPLCRKCHARETKNNSANAFVGDPSKISVEVEKSDEKPKSSAKSKQLMAENGLNTASTDEQTQDSAPSLTKTSPASLTDIKTNLFNAKT